jgi:hypothetical protein
MATSENPFAGKKSVQKDGGSGSATGAGQVTPLFYEETMNASMAAGGELSFETSSHFPMAEANEASMSARSNFSNATSISSKYRDT